MDSDLVLYIAKRTMETGLLISAPVLAVTLVVGFGTAMLQAVTSIRDMTMGMVLKIVAIAVTLLVFGGWMMDMARSFTMEIFSQIQAMGH
jgi:flagellar biosynthetic protein FliQ